MKANMGTLDKAIRVVVAMLFATLFFTKLAVGILGIILLIVGAIFLLTSLVSFCPLYSLLGISTCKNK